VIVAVLFPFHVSDSGQFGDLVDDELGSGGVEGGDQQLREDDSLWHSPLLGLPHFPVFGRGLHVVVEHSFLVDLGSLR